MNKITNLNLLNDSKLIMDDEKNVFIISSATYSQKEQTCALELIQINEFFTKWNAEFPIACNKQMEFISVNDKSFMLKDLVELDINLKDLSKEILALIEKQIKSKDKEVKSKVSEDKKDENVIANN